MRSRFVLVFAVLLAACSDGGSSGPPAVPALPWGSFRHDPSNSGSAGSINNNTGVARLLSGNLGGVTISTPALDNDGNFYVGNTEGVVSVDHQGAVRWSFNVCNIAGSEPVTVGPVTASPTVSAGGTIVVGSDNGYIFALHQRGNGDIECMWYFRPGDASPTFQVQSSPVLQLDPRDLSLLSVFIGGGDGQLLALNGIGTSRWAYPSTSLAGGAVSSSPAADAFGNLYLTTPEGMLASVDFGGRPNWTYPIGVPPAQPLLPSPGVGNSVYAIGAGGHLYALTQNGILKWQYEPREAITSGSPAFLNQTFESGPNQVVDTIVYIADVEGTLYGVRDLTGTIAKPQRCEDNLERSCRTDSCLPDGTCNTSTSRCQLFCSPDSCLPDNGSCEATKRCSLAPDVVCTADTCLPDNGTCDASTDRCTPESNIVCSGDSCPDPDTNPCIELPGIVTAGSSAVPVQTSPAVSGDLFIVVGTADGQVCARAQDNSVPGDDEDETNPWLDGCVDLDDEEDAPTLSSPIIGPDARIYVTTAAGLYVIE